MKWREGNLTEEIIVIFKYLESIHVEEETLALIEHLLVYELDIMQYASIHYLSPSLQLREAMTNFIF